MSASYPSHAALNRHRCAKVLVVCASLRMAALEALPVIATAVGPQEFGPCWQRFAEEGTVRLCQPAIPAMLRSTAIGAVQMLSDC